MLNRKVLVVINFTERLKLLQLAFFFHIRGVPDPETTLQTPVNKKYPPIHMEPDSSVGPGRRSSKESYLNKHGLPVEPDRVLEDKFLLDMTKISSMASSSGQLLSGKVQLTS